jgi:hypothetical protein
MTEPIENILDTETTRKLESIVKQLSIIEKAQYKLNKLGFNCNVSIGEVRLVL